MSDDIERIDSDDIERIDIKEFRELGYLQEVNRLFFHPLGLALEVVTDTCHHPGVEAGSFPTDRCKRCDDEGLTHRLGGIWDSRGDPEGFLFATGMLDQEKIDFVKAEFERRRGHRETLLAPGRDFQLPGDDPDTRDLSDGA